MRRLLGLLAGACALVGTVVVIQGAEMPRAHAWPTANVSITGHGFGHGRGMGQYGAFGYATVYSWSYSQILSHFYGGTTLGTRGDAPITVELSGLAGQSLVATSGVPFIAGGVSIPAGSAIRLTYLSADTYELAISPGCGLARPRPKPCTKAWCDRRSRHRATRCRPC